ncbi:MAG: exodeoxyribonuclease VII small subunit [Kiritimatiellae bacterium]|nr:exodeoxyribonuclease VII small subunit [Kiritimatiellia bacterium]
MSAKKSDKVPASMTFEKALSRLDTLVSEMDGGDLSLDKMISHFEEGQALIKFCSTKLNEVEKKVEILVGNGDTADFDEDEQAPEAEAKNDSGDLF